MYEELRPVDIDLIFLISFFICLGGGWGGVGWGLIVGWDLAVWLS